MKGLYFQYLCLFLGISLAAGCSEVYPAVALPDYWPSEAWQSDDPSNRNIDASMLEAATGSIPEDLPNLDSLLIIRDGYVVYEGYYNGYEATTIHDIRSVTKSWTSALVGMAQGSGKLTPLDTPLSELLPDYFADGQHQDKRNITLADLLEMRSGIEFEDERLYVGDYGEFEELLQRNLTDFALSFPMAHIPGDAWNYSTLDSQLISAIFQYEMGSSLEEYAANYLFEPLGIEDYTWQADAAGTSIGGGGLYLTPRDMAKLGFLYLHQGQWDEVQLIPSDWAQRSITPQNREAYFAPTGQDEVIEWYGYHWWTWKGDWFYGFRAFVANGFAGQRIFVFPELNLIIVTTANIDGVALPEVNAQEEQIDLFIKHSILPTLQEIEPE